MRTRLITRLYLGGMALVLVGPLLGGCSAPEQKVSPGEDARQQAITQQGLNNSGGGDEAARQRALTQQGAPSGGR